MNERTGGILNTTLVNRYMCAQCFGPLVERYLDDQFVVACPKACQPGGFVTAEYAARRESESLQEFYEVVDNYPALDPRPKLTPEQRRVIANVMHAEEKSA